MRTKENININKSTTHKDFLRFDYVPEVSNFRDCKGYWFDLITDIAIGNVTEIGREFNIIVDSIGRLAAARFRGDANFQGIQMWAIGSGAANWDNTLPPAVSTAIRLVNEIGRLSISISGQDSSIAYIDQKGNPTDELTNRLLVRRQFGRNEVNGDWREFALFGGNATITRNSGVMINHKMHQIITKTSDMTVERNIIFTFN